VNFDLPDKLIFKTTLYTAKGNINIFDTPEELAKGFVEIFKSKIDSLLITNEKINIAISGGNTPLLLFNVLAENYENKIEWSRINFFWADERCVPPDSPESNFGSAYNALFRNIVISPANIHRIKGEAVPEEEAERYSGEVRQLVSAKHSLPSFDLILLGIGEDGHTASIFPGQEELIMSDKLYAVSYHPATGQKRITMTGKIINNSTDVSFLVSGRNKAEIVSRIINKKGNTENLPAANIAPLSGSLNWFMDLSAAEKLEK
jgi:6-phosphogluconolactonase